MRASRANGRIGLLMVASVFAVVVGSRGLATVRPIRFAESPPEGLRVEVTDNPFQVEPYLLRVTLESGMGTSATGLVGKSVVIPLCGDGDGCAIRLIQTIPNSPQSSKLASGEMLTDQVATGWFFYESSAGGASTASGSTFNGSNETALEIVAAGGATCRLRDDSVFDSYQLDAIKASGGPVDCLLRIDD